MFRVNYIIGLSPVITRWFSTEEGARNFYALARKMPNTIAALFNGEGRQIK